MRVDRGVQRTLGPGHRIRAGLQGSNPVECPHRLGTILGDVELLDAHPTQNRVIVWGIHRDRNIHPSGAIVVQFQDQLEGVWDFTPGKVSQGSA